MNSNSKSLTVVVPCYNEEDCLDVLYTALKKQREPLRAIGCELRLLLIDNGSADKTLEMIQGYAEKDPSVLYLSLSRNARKEGALYAGFSHVRSDYIAVMDADLQDDPAMLPQMVKRIMEGEYDRIATYVENRKGQSKVYALFARLFYYMLNKLGGLDVRQGARDYGVMTKRFIDAVLGCYERCRFSKGLFSYVGYKTLWLPCKTTDRLAGNAKWSFWDRAGYALDSIIGYSTAPLHAITMFGLTLSAGSFIFLLFVAIRALVNPASADAGWPSLVCLLLFLGGVILLAIGVLGQYLAKIYQEVKGRPVYYIDINHSDATDEPQFR